MKSAEIRQRFFDFFVQRGHEKVSSSSLIPAQDPTILFTNAGMNQFKDLFLGKEQRSYKSAVSIQKCMRAGGKHNDLDNVGFTARHLTFFEMMGNFSFSAYFKKEAIRYAWDFLTADLRLNPAKLYATVYIKDDEAFDIWHEDIGLPKGRIFRLGEADNFWQMGETGPCGPCSEIYIDRGIEKGCGAAHCSPGCSCDRFLEIWNLVFMQYDRQPGGIDTPLKRVGIDTGMGLERLMLVLENKDSVFQTDLFYHVVKQIEQLTNRFYAAQSPAMQSAFHVLADHIRACSFLIADSVTPSNEGRGYVLRKIIRRAALFNKKLTDKSIFPSLIEGVIQDMGTVYPQLHTYRDVIKNTLEVECDKFSTNLTAGQHIFDRYCQQANSKIITGEQAFKLYDTYGFPLEITRILAHERGFEVDILGFEKNMQEQRERSGKKNVLDHSLKIPQELKTTFKGYDTLVTNSSIIGLIVNNALVDKVPAGTHCWVISDQSPFYVEKGGQVSDEGSVVIDDTRMHVKALKRIDNAIALEIVAEQPLHVGQAIEQIVNRTNRLNIMKNHTATHLLQAALIAQLGKQVRQSGSLVAPGYLRFDFTYHDNLSPENIKNIEYAVNEKIWENIPVVISTTTYEKAIDKGVMAIFGEKYNPEEVRVIEVPGFSAELCGGTHVKATGDIGSFKITEVSSPSVGQKRIVALTGEGALALFQEDFSLVKQLSQEFKVQSNHIMDAIAKQKESLKVLQETLKQERKKIIQLQMPQWLSSAKKIGKIDTSLIVLEDAELEYMRTIAHELERAQAGLYIIVSYTNNRLLFLASLSSDYRESLALKDFAAWLKERFNIQSGGKDFMIQGGGDYVDYHEFSQATEAWLHGAVR